MKTRHPDTTDKSNPLRWDCDKRGCFNVKKRPKIELFAECFPGNIMMSDIDGETEINGKWLRIEWKEDGAPLTNGQRINYRKLTQQTETVVYIVHGDAETMEITNFDCFYNGKLEEGLYDPGKQETCLEQLKAEFVRWAEWAKPPRLRVVKP